MDKLQEIFRKTEPKFAVSFQGNDGYYWEDQSLLVTLSGNTEYRLTYEPQDEGFTSKVDVYCDTMNAPSKSAQNVQRGLESYLRAVKLIKAEFGEVQETYAEESDDGWWRCATPDEPITSLADLEVKVEKYLAIGEQLKRLEGLE